LSNGLKTPICPDFGISRNGKAEAIFRLEWRLDDTRKVFELPRLLDGININTGNGAKLEQLVDLKQTRKTSIKAVKKN
jgi:hypothetical protein